MDLEDTLVRIENELTALATGQKKDAAHILDPAG